jgi:hypothetical protein
VVVNVEKICHPAAISAYPLFPMFLFRAFRVFELVGFRVPSLIKKVWDPGIHMYVWESIIDLLNHINQLQRASSEHQEGRPSSVETIQTLVLYTIVEHDHTSFEHKTTQ